MARYLHFYLIPRLQILIIPPFSLISEDMTSSFTFGSDLSQVTCRGSISKTQHLQSPLNPPPSLHNVQIPLQSEVQVLPFEERGLTN